MKQTIKNLFAIAALTFTLSFVTGLSASMIYQEHQALQPFLAAQESGMEEIGALTAAAESIR